MSNRVHVRVQKDIVEIFYSITQSENKKGCEINIAILISTTLLQEQKEIFKEILGKVMTTKKRKYDINSSIKHIGVNKELLERFHEKLPPNLDALKLPNTQLVSIALKIAIELEQENKVLFHRILGRVISG